MTYCTQAQLDDRYGTKMLLDLTDRAVPKAGVVDADVVNRALADADAEIDGYLAVRYALPLASTPPLLTDIALRVSIYKLHAKVMQEKIKDDYQLARADLLRIAKGDIVLQVAGVQPAAGGSADVRVTDADRTMTVDNMKGFI